MLVSNQVVVTGLQARSPHRPFVSLPPVPHGAANCECNPIRVNKSHVYPFNFFFFFFSKRSHCFSSVRAHGNDVQISPDTFTSPFVIVRRKTAGRKCVRKETLSDNTVSEWPSLSMGDYIMTTAGEAHWEPLYPSPVLPCRIFIPASSNKK